MPRTKSMIPGADFAVQRWASDVFKDLSDMETSREQSVADGATVVIAPTGQQTRFTVTLAGNRTIDFQGHDAGRMFFVRVKQDATGSRTLTWDADVAWPGAVAPTLTATANRSDLFAFYDTGTKYIGWTVGLNFDA